MREKQKLLRKCFALGGIFTMLGLLLSGCCINHEWQEATCSQPRTCAKCGETEGESLEHEWQEADCTTPKTCRLCKETEGEALGHELTEANYQTPAVCTICGESVGEVLVSDFVAHNMSCDAEEGVSYDYVTGVRDAEGVETVAQAVFSDYQTFTEDDSHPAKDGYEWKSIHVTITYSDENSQEYGYRYTACFEDYYNILLKDDTTETIENMNGALYTSHFTVNFNGEDYTECITRVDQDEQSQWNPNTDNLVEMQFSFLVPVGYDGIVIGLLDSRKQSDEDGHIFDVADENTVFFRME